MRSKLSLVASLVFLGLVGIATVFPLIYTLNAGLKSEAGYNASRFAPAVPPDFSALQTMSQAADIPFAYLTTTAVIAASVVLLWIVGGLAAYHIVIQRGRSGVIIECLILAGFMIPFQAIIQPFFVIFSRAGLTNQYHGMVIAFVVAYLPLMTLQLGAYFRGLPREVLEASRVDGASPLRIFALIVAPMARPAFFASGLLCSILMAGSFLLPVIVMTENSRQMLAVRIGAIRSQQGVIPTQEAAGAVLVIVPLVLFYLVTQRHLIRGFSAGSGR